MIEHVIGYGLVLVCVICSTLSQVFQKYAANVNHHSPGGVAIFLNRFTVISFLCLGISLIFWLAALSMVDLHVAYSLLSLSYAFVLIASKWHFREYVPQKRWIGVLLITTGTILVVAGAQS